MMICGMLDWIGGEDSGLKRLLLFLVYIISILGSCVSLCSILLILRRNGNLGLGVAWFSGLGCISSLRSVCFIGFILFDPGWISEMLIPDQHPFAFVSFLLRRISDLGRFC